MIDCVCYPNLENLTLVIKEGDNELDQLAEMPNAPEAWLEPQSGERGKPNLKYPWQQLVLDAFIESHVETLLLKINLAQRAISARLVHLPPANSMSGLVRESWLASSPIACSYHADGPLIRPTSPEAPQIIQ